LPGGTFNLPTGAASGSTACGVGCAGGYLGTTGGAAGYIDPNLKRPYSVTYNVGYQRTIWHDTAVGVAYYYRNNRNLQTTANINAPLSDYTPTTVYLSGANAGKPIINPLTGAPMTLYALTGDVMNSCAAGASNIYTNPTTGVKTPTDNGCGWTETTNNPNANQNHYNGLEFTVTRRLVGRWSAQGGLTIQKDHGVQTTGDFNDPNLNINRYGAIDQDSEFVVRADATYRLPWKFQTSVNYQHETGFPITPTNTFSGLGPGQNSETVNLLPDGGLRYPAVNDTNLRLSRLTSFRERYTMETSCDLFNLFNSHAITTETATEAQLNGVNNTTTFTRPSNFLGPFVARFNVRVSF
jgi:hypothetical protein